jgi:hypothetical protein
MCLHLVERFRQRFGIDADDHLLALLAEQVAEYLSVEGNEHALLLTLPVRAHDIEHEISFLSLVERALHFVARQGHGERRIHPIRGYVRLGAYFLHRAPSVSASGQLT